MQAQCGVFLNGVPLQEADSCLIPLDFVSRPVFSDRPAFVPACLPGICRRTPLLRENLATVTFEAHEADPALRQAARLCASSATSSPPRAARPCQ